MPNVYIIITYNYINLCTKIETYLEEQQEKEFRPQKTW